MGEDDRREDRILKNDPLMFVSKTSEVDVFEIGDVMEFFGPILHLHDDEVGTVTAWLRQCYVLILRPR